MANLPYYTLYPSDFDTDERVRLMDDEELGFFIRCMNHAWLNDGLPADLEEIRRALRESADVFSRKWVRVGPCFPECEDGRRRNPRQEDEREKAVAKVQRAKIATAARERKRNDYRNVNETIIGTSTKGSSERGTRAYDSDSDIGFVSGEVKKSGIVREFPKTATAPDESEPGDGVSVTGWTQAGFESAEAGEMWFQALVVKHPNRKGNTAARTAFLERVLIGQFNRTEFERWYEEQVPIWQKWPMFPNLHSIFTDGEWRFPTAPIPKPQKTDRERGLAG